MELNLDIYTIITYSILVALLLVLSAFYSFSEMAVASSNKFKLKVLYKEEKNKRKKKKINKVISLINNYNETITSVVIFNNIVNVLATTLATTLLTFLLGEGIGLVIAFISMTVLIIIFGELLPKMLAKKYPETGLIRFTFPLYVTKYTLYPISSLLKKIVKQNKESVVSSDAELREIIKDTHHITGFEEELLNKALILDEIKLSKIMIPLSRIASITPTTSKEKILNIIEKNKYTRIPVIQKGVPKGIVNTKGLLIDLAKNKKRKFNISNYLYDVSLFNRADIISDVIHVLRTKRQHMGIVINKQNKVIGIITIEDVIETLVGELYDESDVKIDGVFKINKDSFLIEPTVNVQWFFKTYLKGITPPIVNNKTSFKLWFEKEQKENPEKIDYFTYKNIIIWIKHDKISKNKIVYELDLV